MRGRGDTRGLVGQSLAGGTAPVGIGHSLAGLTALGNPHQSILVTFLISKWLVHQE